MKQKIDIWPNPNTKVDPRDLNQASKHKSNWATTRKKAIISVSDPEGHTQTTILFFFRVLLE